MTQQTRRRFVGGLLGAGAAAGGILTAPQVGHARRPSDLDRTFVTNSNPAFAVDHPASWRSTDDAITDVLDPELLFWVSSHPLPRRATEIGFPNLNGAGRDVSVVVAWGQSLAAAEHPDHALPFGTGIRLAQFEEGGHDEGANDASYYQQWFAYAGYGLQVFVWIGREGDGATVEAVLESIRPVAA